ncbi:hypothetical protein BKA60DRAFT_259131 [Fusarium oxysporum]|nr:hypothetical protein BKA60DRAFT_259131 [Fusarium oxysporum]
MPCGFALKTDDDRVGCHLKEKHGISKKHRQKLNLLVISLLFPDPDELPKQADRSAPHLYPALQYRTECKYCELPSASHDILSRHLKNHITGRSTLRVRWESDGYAMTSGII